MPHVTHTLTLDDGREFLCQEAEIISTHLGTEFDHGQFTIMLWCGSPAATWGYIPIKSSAVPAEQVMDEIQAILDIVAVPFWENLKNRSILVMFNPDQSPLSREIIGIASVDGSRIHFAETEIRQTHPA